MTKISKNKIKISIEAQTVKKIANKLMYNFAFYP